MDQLPFWEKLITIYGPLALGWPLAYLYRKENKELLDKWVAHAIEDRELKTEMRSSFRALARIVKSFGDEVSKAINDG